MGAEQVAGDDGPCRVNSNSSRPGYIRSLLPGRDELYPMQPYFLRSWASLFAAAVRSWDSPSMRQPLEAACSRRRSRPWKTTQSAARLTASTASWPRCRWSWCSNHETRQCGAQKTTGSHGTSSVGPWSCPVDERRACGSLAGDVHRPASAPLPRQLAGFSPLPPDFALVALATCKPGPSRGRGGELLGESAARQP